jgi:hypothetical protein
VERESSAVDISSEGCEWDGGILLAFLLHMDGFFLKNGVMDQ